MSLTEKFLEFIEDAEENAELSKKAAELVLNAPISPESNGLLALMYHNGIGVERDLDKCFELAEKAAFEGDDALGYCLLGFMCDNIETPDQEHGGPRQKYDHYDAERFYEICSTKNSPWAEDAHLWLGDYYMDFAKGGDPEIAVEHYEAIAENNAEAAGALSDYYWGMYSANVPCSQEERDWEIEQKLCKWTLVAARLNPEEYSYRMGCIYAEGIGLECPSFRLARKYWEDAYDFGTWEAADAIAMYIEDLINRLPEDAPEHLRSHYEREIASWRKLAKISRERSWSEEPDNSVEED